jgi:hypothetical protein
MIIFRAKRVTLGGCGRRERYKSREVQSCLGGGGHVNIGAPGEGGGVSGYIWADGMGSRVHIGEANDRGQGGQSGLGGWHGSKGGGGLAVGGLLGLLFGGFAVLVSSSDCLSS